MLSMHPRILVSIFLVVTLFVGFNLSQAPSFVPSFPDGVAPLTPSFKPAFPGGVAPLTKVQPAPISKFTDAEIATLPVIEYMESPEERDCVRRIHAFPKSAEKRVISFGLYGADAKFTTGAIRNVELRDTYFPGWVCRFYHDDTVPKDVLDKLMELGAELVSMGKNHSGGTGGRFWRFLVSEDPTVDRYLSRDVDSRLNSRDRFAVEDWINSGKAVHNIRDHSGQSWAMQAGMWGGVKGFLAGTVEPAIEKYKTNIFFDDQELLKDVVFPFVAGNILTHDSHYCGKFPDSRPLPTKRPENFQHIGQVFDVNDIPREGDIIKLAAKEAPVRCRPVAHQEWKFG